MSALPFAMASMLCPFIVFAIVVAVIIGIIRSAARSGSRTAISRQPQTNVVTELAADGFWILSCPVTPSSLIYYYYWSGGTRHSAQVPYQPGTDGRQFVYTGVKPEQVVISRVVQQSDDGPSDLIIPGIIAADAILNSSSSDDPGPPPSPPPATGFPSAY